MVNQLSNIGEQIQKRSALQHLSHGVLACLPLHQTDVQQINDQWNRLFNTHPSIFEWIHIYVKKLTRTNAHIQSWSLRRPEVLALVKCVALYVSQRLIYNDNNLAATQKFFSFFLLLCHHFFIPKSHLQRNRWDEKGQLCVVCQHPTSV